MAVFLSFRSQGVGGPVAEASVFESDPDAPTLAMTMRDVAWLKRQAAGKHVLFAVHGFNVSREDGTRSTGRLAVALQPGPGELVIGVLWPGDFWVPAVNYPFEGSTAIKTGQKLALLCNSQLGSARSISFASHSLGARVVLETVKNLAVPARVMCIAAGAVNDDCLKGEYARAATNSKFTPTLSSREDWVLELAYPVGDVIADLLHLDHVFGEPALGRNGPTGWAPASEVAPFEIPDKPPYGHGNYFPPGASGPPGADDPWRKVAAYIGQVFRGEPTSWPPETH